MAWQRFAQQQASLRATAPATCKIGHILWMMELFNITGSSEHGRAAQKTSIQEAILSVAGLNA